MPLLVLLACGTILAVPGSNAGENPVSDSPDPATHSGDVPQSRLLQYLADNTAFVLIDARGPEEFAASHINGAVNIPHDAESIHIESLPENHDRPIVTYCRTGKRAEKLRIRLYELGYTDVSVLRANQVAWHEGLAIFNCGAAAVVEAGEVLPPGLTAATAEETE